MAFAPTLFVPHVPQLRRRKQPETALREVCQNNDSQYVFESERIARLELEIQIFPTPPAVLNEIILAVQIEKIA